MKEEEKTVPFSLYDGVMLGFIDQSLRYGKLLKAYAKRVNALNNPIFNLEMIETIDILLDTLDGLEQIIVKHKMVQKVYA